MYTNNSENDGSCIDSLMNWHVDDSGMFTSSISTSATRPTQHISVFAKTKVCSFHLRGMCAHGDLCSYAHDIGQLRVQPDLAKTRMCPKRVACAGRACSYAHSREELRGTEDVYKTSLCRFWSAGRCSAGDQCRHAHGLNELRGHDEILPVPPGFDTL